MDSRTGGNLLAPIENEAREAGVACDIVYERNDSPYESIIRVAEQNGCDLIMMASHGRKGVQALLLGSETQKVLTRSKIPVLAVPLNVGAARDISHEKRLTLNGHARQTRRTKSQSWEKSDFDQADNRFTLVVFRCFHPTNHQEACF